MKSRSQRLFALLSILAGMAVVPPLSTNVSAAETAPICLSGVVYREQEADAGLTDVFLAELSKQSGVNILDRSAMKLVFGELSLANLSDDALNQVRLGKIMGVDYFAWIRLSEKLAILEVVEAATGRGVVVTPFRFEQGKLSNTWPAIAAEAGRAARQGAPPVSAKMPSLAMTNPRLVVTNETVNSASEALLAQLSGELGGEGVTVLPRRFTQELVTERWRAEKGLVQSDEQRQLLGADYILTFTVDETPPVLEMGLVETKTGRRIGKFREPLAEDALGINLKRWLLERLRLVVNQPLTVMPVTTNTQVLISETLEAFYKGMVLHNQGYYLDAAGIFNAIQTQNPEIKEPYCWMESCCRLAGFPEIADEYPNYSTNVLRLNTFTSVNSFFHPPAEKSLLTQAKEGVSLIGVTSALGLSKSLTGVLGILLVDALYENTHAPVLVAEDIAGLRDEYDLLLGLDNVKGVTWWKSPALLLSKAITANVETNSDGLVLCLCLVENLDPHAIKESRTRLPAERSQWRDAVHEAIQKLMADQSGVAWKAPRLIFAESKAQLHDRVKIKVEYCKFDFGSYLKLLSLDTSFTGYLRACIDPVRSGLKCWFARVLPKDHPDLPIIEFAVASHVIENGFGESNAVAQSAKAFRKVAEKYPDHPAGLVARYDELLAEMNTDNFEKTQAEMSKILSTLDRSGSEVKCVNKIRNMESALRFALGKPGGKPENTVLIDHFIIADRTIGLSQQEYKDERLGLSFISPDSRSWHMAYKSDYVFPQTREKMRIDLAFLCAIRNSEYYYPAILRSIEKYGNCSELSKYVALKYFRDAYLTNESRKQWSEEALLIVFTNYVAAVRDLLGSNPPALSKKETSDVMWMIADMPGKEPFLGMRDSIKQAMAKAPTTPAPSADAEVKVRAWNAPDIPWVVTLDERSNRQPSITNVMIYCEYLDRLHADFDGKKPVTHEMAELYCQFAIVFYRGKRYDLAEPLLDRIILWRDSKGRPPAKRIYPVALYLLATLKVRNGDKPQALAFAKESLAFLEKYPETNDRLPERTMGDNQYYRFDYLNDAKIGSHITELLKTIRENPQAKFKNAYE